MTSIPFVPVDADDHLRLGDWYVQQGRLMEAQAEYRTAQALGSADPGLSQRLAQVYQVLGGSEPAARKASLKSLDHNRYARMTTLAGVVAEHGPATRVLDIGGGDGLLALFLPEAQYVLAEPGTNGLDARDLPFARDSFDVVLSCHVLEHIPAEGRHAFLAALCGLARRELVLLNPFRPAGTAGDEPDRWLELVWGITQAPWAREHLDCGLPLVAEVEEFARARGFGFRAQPSGIRAVSTLHVLLGHYARLAGKSGDLAAINGLLNGLDPATLDSAAMPTAWLVRLDVTGDQKEGEV